MSSVFEAKSSRRLETGPVFYFITRSVENKRSLQKSELGGKAISVDNWGKLI
jgi:hypothetical protein